MKRVPLQEVAPGMVLVKPVTNSAGHVVVAAGMTLDEPLITHLERMGKAAHDTGDALNGQADQVSAKFDDLARPVSGTIQTYLPPIKKRTLGLAFTINWAVSTQRSGSFGSSRRMMVPTICVPGEVPSCWR